MLSVSVNEHSQSHHGDLKDTQVFLGCVVIGWVTGFLICSLWVIKIASNLCAVHM